MEGWDPDPVPPASTTPLLHSATAPRLLDPLPLDRGRPFLAPPRQLYRLRAAVVAGRVFLRRIGPVPLDSGADPVIHRRGSEAEVVFGAGDILDVELGLA